MYVLAVVQWNSIFLSAMKVLTVMSMNVQAINRTYINYIDCLYNSNSLRTCKQIP